MDYRNKAARTFHSVEFLRPKYFGKFVSGSLACLLAGALLAGFALSAGPAVFHRDHIEYRWAGTTAAEARRLAAMFHPVFLEEVESQYRSNRMGPPRKYSIFLAGDGAAFQKATGSPWYVAGMYDPDRDRFFFQNPKRLKARNLLRRTAAHEVCHQILARAHRAAGARRSGADRRWLEESYCEAISATPAACTKQSEAINRLVRRASGVAAIRRAIESGKDRSSSVRAACLARLFGRHLMATYGRREFFALVTEKAGANRHAKARLARAFAGFQKKFQ